MKSFPLFKLTDLPLLPVAGSWVDATPYALMFLLLLGAALAATRLRGRARQAARRVIQSISAFVFIIFLHRCICMLRGWAFAMSLMGRNNVLAFGHACMFVVIIAVGMAFGRFFCGWICPLHLLQEGIAGIYRRRVGLSSPRLRRLAGYLLAAGLTVLLVWLAYLVRPGTQFFSENVAAVWGLALLALIFMVVAHEHWDARAKKLKYVSLVMWLGLSLAGVFVTNPWCVLYGDELDYSSLVALLAVVSGGAVISLAWCRYLCPAGATLAVAAELAALRVSDPGNCRHCGRCELVCPTGALKEGRIDQSSCTYCGRCLENCGFEWVRGTDSTPREVEQHA